jgi:selenocysteine-specific elongation factor
MIPIVGRAFALCCHIYRGIVFLIMSHIIIGTAGHIDHGKSSLVKALTGTDPDRLVEEQERGMTIDLGFAFLTDDIAFIDVPGHERFVKNMVAGVRTVDMVILVIAADDGVMPQTREHMDILSLLQIKRGLIALTKTDLADKEWIHLVKEDIRHLTAGTFLQDAPIMEVSTVTGTGLETLRTTLIDMARQTQPRADRGLFWMPVDRSFTVKGFGTVVTGSVLSGTAHMNDALEILPGRLQARVRGLQAHGKPVDHVKLGDRAALNLSTIAKDDVGRGDVLATAGVFKPSSLFDASLTVLKTAKKPLTNRTRVRLHIGTREIMGRIRLLNSDAVEPGSSAPAQIQLEEETVAMRLDPFVIRRYSPPTTIAGGIILNTNPKPHRRFDDQVIVQLQKMMQQDPAEVIITALLNQNASPVSSQELARITGLPHTDVESALQDFLNSGSVIKIGKTAQAGFFHVINLEKLTERAVHVLQDFHAKSPLKPGMAKAEFKNGMGPVSNPLFDFLIGSMLSSGQIKESAQWLRLAQHSIRLNEKDLEIARTVIGQIEQSGYSTPSINDLVQKIGGDPVHMQAIMGAMQGTGELLRLEGDIYFSRTQVDQARDRLLRFAESNQEISVSQFRELLGTSRKYAMALLGYFDQTGVTERVGDTRVVKRTAQ